MGKFDPAASAAHVGDPAAALSLVTQLRARLELADRHLVGALHLADIGEDCIASMHAQRDAAEPCGRVLQQIRERIEWTRAALIRGDAGPDDEQCGGPQQLTAPSKDQPVASED